MENTATPPSNKSCKSSTELDYALHTGRAVSDDAKKMRQLPPIAPQAPIPHPAQSASTTAHNTDDPDETNHPLIKPISAVH